MLTEVTLRNLTADVAVLHADSGSLTARSLTISQTAGIGLYTSDDASVSLEGGVFSKVGKTALRLSGGVHDIGDVSINEASTGLTVEGATLTLRDASIAAMSRSALELRGGVHDIANLSIESTQGGLYAEGARLTIRGARIKDTLSKNAAIFLRSAGATVLTDLEIGSVLTGIATVGQSSDSFLISNSTILAGGVSLLIEANNATGHLIQSTDIASTGRYAVLIKGGAQAEFRGSQILAADLGLFLAGGGTAAFEQSTVHGDATAVHAQDPGSAVTARSESYFLGPLSASLPSPPNPLEELIQRALSQRHSEVKSASLEAQSGDDYTPVFDLLRTLTREESERVVDRARKSPGYAVASTLASPLPVGADDITTLHESLVMPGGVLALSFRDLSIPGRGWPIEVTRSYRDRVGRMPRSFRSPFGYGWTWNQGQRFAFDEKWSFLFLRADGLVTEYLEDDQGVLRPTTGFAGDSFLLHADGGYLREFPDGRTEVYAADGWITARTAQEGLVQQLTHQGELPNSLIEITGRRVDFVYKGGRYPDGDRIAEVRGPDGATVWRYDYNDNFLLSTVTDALGRTTRFEYDKLQHISRIDFADGSALAVARDQHGRVVELSGPGDLTTRFEHDFDIRDGVLTMTVIDRAGRRKTHRYSSSEQGYSVRIKRGELSTIDVDYRRGQASQARDHGTAATVGRDSDGALSLNAGTKKVALQEPPRSSRPAVGQEIDNTGMPVRFFGDRSMLVVERDLFGRPLTLTDASGKTVFRYDAAGQLVATISPTGSETRFSYDEMSRFVSASGPDVSIKREFDAAGRLARVTLEGEEWTYGYDPSGRLTKVSGPEGTLDIAHDDAGRVQRFETDTGEIYRFTRSSPDVEDIHYPGGEVLRAVYGPEKLPLRIARIVAGGETAAVDLSLLGGPDGWDGEARHSSDGLVERWRTVEGGLETEVSLNGRVLKSERRDRDGRLVHAASGDAETKTEFLNSEGVFVHRSNDGSELRVEHDGFGRMVRVEDEAGQTALYSYDELGRLISRTLRSRGAERRAEFTYDAESGVRVTESGGAFTELTFDEEGRLTTAGESRWRYDPDGRIAAVGIGDGETAISYDSENRISELGGPGGLKLEYDEWGKSPAALVGPDGARWALEYGTSSLPVATTDPMGVERRVIFDESGRPLGLRDAEGRGQDLLRDALGRVTGHRIVDGPAVGYRLNAFGEVVEVSRGESSLALQRDGFGQLLSVRSDEETLVRLDYQAGRVTAASTPLGTARFEWGPFDQPLAIGDPFGGTLTHRYDGAGRLEALAYSQGEETSYTRDQFGRVSGLKVGSTTLELERGAGGALRALGFVGGPKVVVAYEPGGQPKRIAIVGPEGDLAALRYERNGLGAPLLEERLGGTTRRFSYDAVGRLIAVEGGGVRKQYGYDGSGALTAIGDTELEYDQRFALTKLNGAAVEIDALGQLVSLPDGTRFTHNVFGQVSSVSRPGQPAVTYRYDHAGRIAEREAAGQVRRFIYDHFDRVVRVLDAQGAELARIDWIPDLSGIALVSYPEGEPELYIPDTAGTPFAAVSKDGAVRRLTFDVWGQTGLDARDLAYGALGYSGGVMDPDYGLSFFGARTYLAQIGRFTAPDPKGPAGGFNPYVYALNSPLLFGDERGTQPSIEVPFGPPGTTYDNPLFPPGPAGPHIRGTYGNTLGPAVLQDLDDIARQEGSTPRGIVARQTGDLIRRGHVGLEFHGQAHPKGYLGVVDPDSPRVAKIYPNTVSQRMQGAGLGNRMQDLVRANAGLTAHEVTHAVQRARPGGIAGMSFVERELEARIRHALIDPRMAGLRNPNLQTNPVSRLLYNTLLSSSPGDARNLTAANAARVLRPYLPHLADAELQRQAQMALDVYKKPANQIAAANRAGPGRAAPFGTRAGAPGLSRFMPALRVAGRAGMTAFGGAMHAVSVYSYLEGQTSTAEFLGGSALFLATQVVPGSPVTPIATAHALGTLLGQFAAQWAINEMMDPNSRDGRLLRYLLEIDPKERSRFPCNFKVDCKCHQIEAGILTGGWKQECFSVQARLREYCAQRFQEHGSSERAVSETPTCQSQCSVCP